jgi:sodium/hydrogen exchanger 8
MAYLSAEEDKLHVLGVAIIVALVVLGLAFVGGQLLERYRVFWMPEAGLAILLGACGGALSLLGARVEEDLTYDFDFFMIWLIPPIIFEAGFNLDQQTFNDAIVPMLGYAFAGTGISTFAVGGIVYGASQLGLCHPLGGMASLTFGALISSTDPVTVLSVFTSLGVAPELFALVFGESVMNDAVAIVLARTFLELQGEEVTTAVVAGAIVRFAYVFITSMVIGVAFGCGCAFAFRLLDVSSHPQALFVEVAMTVVWPWTAFYLCEALELSGIVAILFCGMAMARYARPNLSRPARILSARMFKVIALIAETFVFCYLGMAVFTLPVLTHAAWRLFAIALGACLLARFANIGLVSLALRAVGQRVPLRFQMAMWWSGLRGGVAFAIASMLFSEHSLSDAEGELAILQATMAIAVTTIFVFGGTIVPICERLRVLHPSGKSDLHEDTFEEDRAAQPWSNKGQHGWLARIDAQYVVPALCGQPSVKLERRFTPIERLRADELLIDEGEDDEPQRRLFGLLPAKKVPRDVLNQEIAQLKARVAELEALTAAREQPKRANFRSPFRRSSHEKGEKQHDKPPPML